MARTLGLLLVALLLVGCSQMRNKLRALAPLPPLSPEQVKSPLALSVYLPARATDLDPVRAWIPADSLPEKLYVMVRVTNISDRPVVLPGFCHWAPGFTFSSKSDDARQPPFFRSLNGQIDWIILKPHDAAYAYDNIADQVAFLHGGRYTIQYQLQIAYADYRGKDGTESESTLADEYKFTDEFLTAKQGEVEIDVSPSQVTSN